jgi:hypothetical protein
MNPLMFLFPEQIVAKKLVKVAGALISHVQGKHLEDDLKAGRLPVISNPPILLSRGELCHHLQADVVALQKKTVTVARGSAGVSLRYKIAPGLSIGGRIGASAPAKSEQLIRVAHGNLIVTNKRLVISGLNGALELPFSKLIDVQAYSDCLFVSLKGKATPLYLTRKGLNFSLLARIVQVAVQGT